MRIHRRKLRQSEEAKPKDFCQCQCQAPGKASERRNLFSHMILVAESKHVNMKDSLIAHPLGPLPLALATPDGTLRKRNKVALVRELEKNASAANEILPPSSTMIDGMAMV